MRVEQPGDARRRRAEREHRRRIALLLLFVGVVGVSVAIWISRRPDPAAAMAPPILPPEAIDPGNRAILIDGGALPRRRGRARDPSDDVASDVGPRSTIGEGGSTQPVPAFWIQEHEVTNEEFARHDSFHEFPDGEERHPVANITFEEARSYAASLGGRLPTEVEWEFAASGPEGRRYPWGDSEPTCELAWHRDCGPRGSIEVMTRPDGATPDGLHDLAGNVWEWVTPNWFDSSRTPVNTETRRLRGGSFDDPPFFLRAANRNNDFFEGYKYVSVGFRVVWGRVPGRN